MFIESITLIGNKRLLLRNVQEFRATFTEIYQLLLGTNGSGKTTVIGECNPLPALPADYVKGMGMKIIVFTHRGARYRCESDFTGAGRHRFWRDDEQLNPGGTATVQRELVSQYIGIDQDLIEVLLDQTLFTLMPAIQRREWIMRLSGNDMTYAMRIYNVLRGKARDVQGVVKHFAKRLSEEIDKLPSEDEVVRLRNVCDELRADLTLLMEAREPQLPRSNNVTQGLDKLMQTLERVATDILRTTPIRPSNAGVLTVDNVSQRATEIRDARVTAESRLSSFQEEHTRVYDIVNAIQASNIHGAEDFQGRVAELEAARLALHTRLGLDFVIPEDAQQISIATDMVFDELMDIFATMPPNVSRRHAEEQRLLTQARLDVVKQDQATAQMEHLKILHRLDHIDKASQQNCPRCGFIWFPGVQENEPEVLTALRDAQVAKLAACVDEIANIEAFFEENNIFRHHLRRLNQAVKNYPVLQPLWGRIADAWAAGAEPRLAIPVIIKWRADIQLCWDISKLDKEIGELRAALQHANEVTNGNISHFSTRLATIIAGIESSTQEVDSLRGVGRMFDTFQQQVRSLETKGEELLSIQRDIEDQRDLLIRCIRNETIGHLISDAQSGLAHAETALSKATLAHGLIAEIKRSREEALLDAEAFGILVDELSPVDGLIADQIKGFIACFTDQINAIIQKIWTVDMAVQPCGLESGDLTYKFPIVINNSDLLVPDIARGSASQRDIVNFAFKLVVGLYLGMDDYPLFLDELAITMDEQHRIRIIQFLKAYVESKRASQCFIISHYASQHGAFHPVETCVMDTTNILTLPDVYNQHVVIK